MSDDIFGSFIEKKKAESAFVILEDGETIVVKKLKNIKLVTKLDFGGEDQEFLRLICEVETSEGIREKKFDNSTQRFAKELQNKGVVIGCGFSLTRTGEQTKTRYTVSNVKSGDAPATPAPTAAPVTPSAAVKPSEPASTPAT